MERLRPTRGPGRGSARVRLGRIRGGSGWIRARRNRSARIRSAEPVAGPIGLLGIRRILGIGTADAAKALARWCKQGWLSRIKRGIYVPVPVESISKDRLYLRSTALN